MANARKVKQAELNALDISTLKEIVVNRASSDEMKQRAVKALGRYGTVDAMEFLDNIVFSEEISSLVCREAISAIGRNQLHEGALRIMGKLLHIKKDPKILCQIIRGLRRCAMSKEFVSRKEEIEAELAWAAENVKDVELKKLAQQPLKRRPRKVETTDVMPHPLVLDEVKNLVIEGDSAQELTKLPDGCVHLTFTSPPYYNARDYSIYSSYNEYLDQLCAVFKEVLRVTKMGRFLVVNTSPVIMPRISRNHQSKRYPITFDLHARLVAMGWEFVDDIVWEKPEFSVKNRNGQFGQHRKPLTYKPNSVTEYLMVYRKPTDRLIDWNLRCYNKETMEASRILGNYDNTNIWRIQPVSNKKHSAVFSVELCEKVIKYYSFKGDLILDPFAGTGTVALAAHNLDRNFLMVEMNDGYTKVICDSLKDKNLEFKTRNID